MHRSDKAEMRERHAKTAIKNIKNSVFPTHNGILSHVAAFVLTVGFVIYTSSSKKEESTFTKFFATLIRFIHLFGFATWFGVQFWVHVTGKCYRYWCYMRNSCYILAFFLQNSSLKIKKDEKVSYWYGHVRYTQNIFSHNRYKSRGGMITCTLVENVRIRSL